MALDTASKKALTDMGFDVAKLETAITTAGDQPFAFTPKMGEIKVGESTYHVFDTAGMDGFKGRLKNEVLAQSTELGVKAVAAAFDVDYKGNDPLKLKEAAIAKLNIPIDDKIKEKDRDILSLKTNWDKDKTRADLAEKSLNDYKETERDISYFPADTIKSVKAKTLRMELKEEGITYGDHEGKPAVFVNGEVQKNADLTIVDPKVFNATKFKEKGWIAEAAAAAAPVKKTFDASGKEIGGQGTAVKFDHKSAHEQALAESGGKYDDKYQSVYTSLQLAAAKPAGQA